MKRTKNIKDLKYSNHNKKNNYKYLLLEKGFSKKDLDSGIKILKTGKITMNKETRNFENQFAKKLKVKYAVMTNSGSSANLLATYAANNPLRVNKFKRGDEAIVPCTLKEPAKSFRYTAIVCNALLLFIPGLASIALDVNCKGPPVPVKLLTSVLGTNSGYAPSSNSIVPAAAYPVSEYVISLAPSDFTSRTAKL